MLKKTELKKVKIGSFNGILTGGYATTVEGVSKAVIYAELNEDSIKEIICIIDLEKENAIDIFTGEVYHVLKRDEEKRIIEDIETDRYYVLSISRDNVISESQLYNIYLNYMASQAKNKYIKNNNCKVKVLNKNENNKK